MLVLTIHVREVKTLMPVDQRLTARPAFAKAYDDQVIDFAPADLSATEQSAAFTCLGVKAKPTV